MHRVFGIATRRSFATRLSCQIHFSRSLSQVAKGRHFQYYSTTPLPNQSLSTMDFKYPSPRRDDQIDDYYGTKVEDPYRWMEDPDSRETQEWCEQENKITNEYLSRCPSSRAINKRLTEMYNYPKYSVPFKRGGRYFYYHNTGLQNQSVMYVQDSLESDAKVFLDPNAWTTDGTASIGTSKFSESGRFFAYGVSKSGSDWQTIHVKDVESNEVLQDCLEWAKFTSIAWTHDDKGFYYSRFPEKDIDEDKRGTEGDKNENQKVYYHKIGDKQCEDKLVLEDIDHPAWMYGIEVSDDGKFLLISVQESCDPVNALYIANLEDENSGLDKPLQYRKVVDNFDASYNYITNEGNLFYFQTNLDAPRYRIISIDLEKAEQDNWIEVLPQSSNVLQSAFSVAEKYMALIFMEDAKEIIQLYTIVSGKAAKKRDLPVPAPGSISGYSGRKDQTEIFYAFTSFTYPGTIYRFDVASDNTSVFRETKVAGFDPSSYHTEQVFYESKDGTRIPMFLVHPKSLKKDSDNLTYLYGYGGFSISLTPYFSSFRCALLEGFQGVLAIPNLRGGGEYGEDWHKGGVKEKKQNVFDDFQQAAKYLVQNKYTSPNRIAISGGSNGGLLVGACITQAPELFGAAVAQVGVLDMLRFHKFTIGHFWCSDYGSSDNASDFEYLIKYSPLHNIRTGKQLPSTLLTTADHDDRVVPAHSFKFMAALQHALGKEPYQKNPLLIRVETKAGHGAGKPTSKIIEEITDIYSFLSLALGVEWKG